MAPRKYKKILGMHPLMAGALFAIIVIGAVFVGTEAGVLQQVPTGTENEPAEGFFIVDAKILFTVNDKYDGTATVGDGSLYLYDTANPGTSLETISVSSGTGTSARFYESGVELGVVYKGSSSYLSFSWLITVPEAKSDDAGQTLNCDTIMEVVQQVNANWAMYITKGSEGEVWTNGSASAVDAFKPDTDASDETMGVGFRVTGNNYAFTTAGGYFDYSEDNSDLQARKSYYVIRFLLNASDTSMTDINDYLKFGDLGGAIKYEWGTEIVLLKEITTETEAGVRDTDTQGNSQGGLTGNAQPWTIEYDFSGAISGTAWTDEIVIQLSVVHGFAAQYADIHESLTQTGDTPRGYMASDLTYTLALRISMG